MPQSRALVLKVAGEMSGAERVFGQVGAMANTLGGNVHRAGALAGQGMSLFSQALDATGSPLGALMGSLSGTVDHLSTVQTALGKTEGKMAKLKLVAGPAMLGIGAAASGLGVALETIADPAEKAQKQLEASFEAAGKDINDYTARIDGAVGNMEKFGYTSGQTKDALNTLLAATHDPQKALDALGHAADYAAFKHVSLNDAATAWAKGLGGNAKILKQFGIDAAETAKTAGAAQTKAQNEVAHAESARVQAMSNLQKAQLHLADAEAIASTRKKLTIGQEIQLRNLHDAVAAAQLKVKETTNKVTEAHQHLNKAQKDVADAASANEKNMGKVASAIKDQAASAADTFGGKLEAVKAHLTDIAATAGEKLGPALSTVGPMMMGVGAIMETRIIPNMFKGIATAVTWAGGQLAAAGSTAAAWIAANAAMLLASGGVLLLVAAIAAGVIWVVKNWDTVKEKTAMVWNWVVDHIKQAAVFLVNLFMKWSLPGLIFSHWDAIKNAAKEVWDWICDKVGKARDFVVFLFKNFTLPGIILSHWDAIKKGAQEAWDWVSNLVTGTIDKVVGFVSGVGSRIAAAASGMWDGIKDSFKAVLNWIFQAWNSIHLSLPSFDTHIPGIGVVGGFEIQVPQIPLLARGGTTTGEGWAIVGEQGPEPVYLPKGATVVPNATATASGFGRGVTIASGAVQVSVSVGAQLGVDGRTATVPAAEKRQLEETVQRAVDAALGQLVMKLRSA